MASVDLDQRTTCDIPTVVVCLQQQLDISQHENQQLKQNISDQHEQYQRDQDYLELRVKGIIQENDSLYATQERLESDLYAKEQELEVLRKETQHWKRLHKDLNKSLEVEREEFDKNRSSWLHRESQFTDTIRLLQQQRQQKDHQHQPSFKGRNGLLSARSAPCLLSVMEKFDYTPVGAGCQQTVANLDSTLGQLQSDEQTGAPSSPTAELLGLEHQGTIKAQKDIITTLRAELEKQASKLQQQHLLDNQKVSTQMKNLMAEVDNIKQLNQSLMEENESYQILLHEKTISGDFVSDSMVQFEYGCQDDYFGHNKDQGYLPQVTEKSKERHGLNLADELALASAVQTNSTKNPVLSTEEELLGEIKTLQDANRALQLYMNKILLRIVENKHLENILSIDEPNKGQKTTTTIIKSSATATHLQSSTVPSDGLQRHHMNLSQANYRPSFSSTEEGEDDEMSTSSSDTNSTKTTEASDDTCGDSWTQVFRRMSSGFTGWTRSSDTEPKFSSDDSPSVQVDQVVRTLYCLNK